MIIKENDLIQVFDEILKMNRVTKKVILGTKRNPINLFGQYDDVVFNILQGECEISLFRDIKTDSGTYLRIYQDEDVEHDEFDLCVYGFFELRQFKFLNEKTPLQIKVIVKNGEIILKNKNIEARY